MNPEVGMIATIESALDLIPAVVTAVEEGISVTVRQEADGGFYAKDTEHTYPLNEDGTYGDMFDRVFEFGVQHTFSALEELGEEK